MEVSVCITMVEEVVAIKAINHIQCIVEIMVVMVTMQLSLYYSFY